MMNDKEMLAFLTYNRNTHDVWARFFEDHPEEEAKYLSTGVWESAKKHREVARNYTDVINRFRKLARL